MNPTMNILAQENKVGDETESIYTEDFFNSLTAVNNALDNVAARQYIIATELKPSTLGY